jgi:hypothetical protein
MAVTVNTRNSIGILIGLLLLYYYLLYYYIIILLYYYYNINRFEMNQPACWTPGSLHAPVPHAAAYIVHGHPQHQKR